MSDKFLKAKRKKSGGSAGSGAQFLDEFRSILKTLDKGVDTLREAEATGKKIFDYIKEKHDYLYEETKTIAAGDGVWSENAKKALERMDQSHQQLKQIQDGLTVKAANVQADILSSFANAANDAVSIELKTDEGLTREIEQLKVDRAKLEEAKKTSQFKPKGNALVSQKAADNYAKRLHERSQPEYEAKIAAIDAQLAAIKQEQEARSRAAEASKQDNDKIKVEEQETKAANAIKEAIPAAIEKAKADCSCIEQAFQKYFSKDNLSALCCNGAGEASNDNALVGSVGDDMLFAGTGNDPLSGGGFNSGFDLAANYAFYGMGQQAMRTSLLPDPRKENEQAQELEGIYKTVSNTIGNSFTQLFQDVIVRGKSFRESLSSLFGNIANSLLNTFLDKVMGSLSKGISGFVEQALPSIFNFFFAANGGVMTSGGPLPLRTYAKGGIATSPQMAIFGEGSMNEAYVPLPDGRRIPVNMNMEGKPTKNSGNVYQITQNVTVQGTPGQSQEDSDRVAAQMMDSLDRAMTEKIDDRIRQSQRVGGISNPLRRIA